MKILNLVLLFLIVGHTLAAGAVEYHLSGTVTQKGGGPLEGVKVLLKGQNASVVTKTDGTFEITSPVSVKMNAPEKQTLSFALRGNAVAFSTIAEKLSGNVTVLSGNGRLIASTDFSDLNPATEQVSLPKLAAGINIVRATINNTVYTCQVVQMGRELHLINRHTSSADKFNLSKSAAASDTVDTLVAGKDGFKDAVLPITSYTKSGISIEMTENSSTEGYPGFPGAGCDVTAGEYGAVDNPKLPNPFKMRDGSIVSTMAEWECRRAEIIRDLEKFEVGPMPSPSETQVTATFSGGVLKVTVTSKDGSLTMSNKVSGSGKGVVIGFGGGGSMVSGCTKIAFDHAAIAKDGMTGAAYQTDGYYKVFPHLWKTPTAGNEGNEIVGNYGAWSWGVSRMIDGMELVKDEMGIDMSKISIHGCSWAGKGALWAGALDTRIALVVGQETGGGGAAAWRISDDIETATGKELEDLDNTGWSWFIDWLLDPYIASGGGGKNPHLLPHDHHELVALIAPRALILLPGNSTSHLCAPSAYASFMAARQVWKAMGIEDRAGLVTNNGSHCSASSAQQAATDKFVNRFINGGNDNTNIIDAAGATYDWEQYVDWDTPTIPYP